MSPLLAFPILLCLVAGILVLFFSAMMARNAIAPPRMNDGKAMYLLRRLSPGDLGLTFEPLKFIVRDAATSDRTTLSLAAWWIPNPVASTRCVILLHGFADAKVGSIAWAPTWIGVGFNVLAIDLRAHGESGGRFATAGFFERSDLSQVIDQLRVLRATETRQVVLFGISYGGAVALATAAQRDDIDAVVLDSPFGDFEKAVAARARQEGGSFQLMTTLANRFARQMSRADYSAVRPIDLLPHVHCPVQLIQSSNDRGVDPNDFDALRDTLQSRGNPHDDSWLVDDCAHLLALAKNPTEYALRVEAFCEMRR